MTIWFDVEDLMAYFDAHRRPSGIQRLSFQVYQAVWALADARGAIGFCRHDTDYTQLVEVDWPALEQGIRQDFLKADTGRTPAREQIRESDALQISRRRASAPVRWLAKALLNDDLRNHMGMAYYRAPTQANGLRLAALAAFAYFRRQTPTSLPTETHPIEKPELTADLQDGDTLVALGSLWDPRFSDLLRRLREGRQIRFATMIYDLIPIILPQFTDPPLVAWYTDWLRFVVPQADILLTISKTSARDLTAVMGEQGQTISPPVILPIGATPRFIVAAPQTSRPYVLFVSTLEPRKNHALLLSVWERLLASMPVEQVPGLVFAGRTIRQSEAAGDVSNQVLGEHFRIVDEPDDRQLHTLYQHCLFTVYPSFYEGWGLPVTESLSFGKTAAVSDRGSLREAGQDFCVYFDPGNLDDATAVIRGLIEHPERVAAYEAAIAARFRPPRWSDTARALLTALYAHAEPVARCAEPVN